MKTRTWLTMLALLCASGGAAADGMDTAGTAVQPAGAGPAMEQAPVRARVRAHTPKRLPGGDIRYCLDLTSNAAIIRCAEIGRKR
jgi:hypothetical protein